MDYRSVSIDPTAHIAPDCSILGDVEIGAEVTVFSHAALRGDYGNRIIVGAGTNIQENCCLHVPRSKGDTVIGKNVTIGHGAVVHGCTVGDETLIGMGAIILDRAAIGSHCLVAAGALVTQDMVVPDGTLVMGCPARVKRELTEAELDMLRNDAAEYIAIGRDMCENGFMMRGADVPADHPTIGVKRG